MSQKLEQVRELNFKSISWVVYYFVCSLNHIIVVITRKELLNFLNRSTRVWNGYEPDCKRASKRVS